MTPSIHPVSRPKFMLAETRAERIAAAQWTAVIMLSLLSAWLILVWLNPAIAPLPSRTIDIGLSEFPGGATSVHGEINVMTPTDQEDITLELPDLQGFATLAQTAAVIDIPANVTDLTGVVGVDGDQGDSEGRGSGDPGRQRKWMFIVPEVDSRVRDLGTLQKFGFQTAAVFPDGRVVLLVQQGTGRSAIAATTIDEESRMHLRWDSGQLEQIDRQDFEAAGVDVSEAIIVQLISPATQQHLDYLETEYGNNAPESIVRTVFQIKANAGQWVMEVKSQKVH